MLACLIGLLSAFNLGKLASVASPSSRYCLAYEHSLVSSDDLSKLNAAFFTMNGVISVLFFLFVASDLVLRK